MGLLLQLLILPYVFPQFHAGNGMVAGRDWVGFHDLAAVMAQKIELNGWTEFLFRPDGDNAIAGVTSFFYVLFGPHPWTLLPLNGALFATGWAALFSTLKLLDLDDNKAIIATLPYLLFPSALLQYGQIHKDVFCTSGLLVILWSWVGLLHEDRKSQQILPLIAASAVALVIISVFRPYLIRPLLGLGMFLFLWCLARAAWQLVVSQRERVEHRHQRDLIFNAKSIAILVVLNALTYGVSISYFDLRFEPGSIQDGKVKFFVPIASAGLSAPVRSRSPAQALHTDSKDLEAIIAKANEECRPVIVLKDGAFLQNAVNRVFLNIAVARAGFTSARGTTAASNIDVDFDFCQAEDLIRYIPRALQIGLFAPFPSSWFMLDRRNSSSMEVYISAVEMSFCYIAYFGLLYWLVSYRRWRLAFVVPIGFSLGMTLLLGLTVANVGTLYRMRFPYAMIFVSVGMAGIIQVVSSFRTSSYTSHALTRTPTK